MVVGVLVGAQETKVRPAVVIASVVYLAERPNAVVGILTTKLPGRPATTDYVLQDWQSAGLRTESCFRAYDRPSLGIDGDRPPQRPRLGVGESTGSGRLCHLTWAAFPGAPWPGPAMRSFVRARILNSVAVPPACAGGSCLQNWGNLPIEQQPRQHPC